MSDLIERVRTGSHRETVEYGTRGGSYNRVVDDYETVYRDCIPGKDWLKEHEHALDGWEPTIEIKRPDGRKLPVNGNYKPGMIREFMKNKESKLK